MVKNKLEKVNEAVVSKSGKVVPVGSGGSCLLGWCFWGFCLVVWLLCCFVVGVFLCGFVVVVVWLCYFVLVLLFRNE